MRILVTGGAGFVGSGSHVADRLAADGHEPVLRDAPLPQAPGPAGARAARAGPRRRPRGRPVARGRRRVPPGVDGRARIDLTEAPGYAAYNDLDTAVVLAAMHAAGAHRLVLAGSMVIYGEDRHDCPRSTAR